MTRHLFATTITGLEVGCIAGVLFFGARILPADAACAAPAERSASDALDPRAESLAPSSDAMPAPDETPSSATSVLWSEAPVAAPRVAYVSEASSAQDSELPSTRAAHEAKSERDYYKQFLAHGARDKDELESAARRVLAANGAECEKVAVLRAACDAHCRSAFDLLADAALTSPDVRRGDNDSLPRFAVKMLVERSSRDERARLALERVAWSQAVSSELRCIAVAGLASAADGSEAWRIVSRLGIEQDEQVRANALAALARNPAAESARMNAAPNPTTPDGDDRSPQGSGVHDE